MKKICVYGIIVLSFVGQSLLSWGEAPTGSNAPIVSNDNLTEKNLKIETTPTTECHAFFTLKDSATAFLEKEQHQFSKNLPVLSQVKIGRIVIVREKIFNESDPDENGKLYRLANDIHVLTRENVIRQQLTFDSGDSLNYAALEESERILRSTNYLVDAWVVPYQQCGESVDILVMTRDVWSLTPKTSYTKTGSQEIFTATLSEVNLFGQGNSIAVGKIRNEDTETNTFAFHNPFVLGSQAELKLAASDGENVQGQSILFRKPFRSIYSRWTAGISAIENDSLENQYILGEPRLIYQHENSYLNLYGGLASGLINDAVTQWTFGVESDENILSDFDPFAITLSDEVKATFPRDLPDRKQVYPWFTYKHFTNKYQKMQNIEKISRTEDIYTGRMVKSTFGYSSESLDASSDQYVVGLSYRDTLLATNQQLLQYWLSFNSNWDLDRDEEENRIASFDIKYYWLHSLRHRTFLNLSADAGKNMTIDKVLVLGGSNGLRGYPQYFNAGERRVLFTMEQRYYTSLHILNLVNVAGAVFFDVGQAWFNDEAWVIDTEPGDLTINMSNAETGFNKSMGVGLRLVSNEAELSSVVHVDLVFPLDKDEQQIKGDQVEVDSMQFNIMLKSTF